MPITTANILNTYHVVRKKTIDICAPLETEDYVVQPVVDVSPPKWHLGHTTWFFEEFILSKFPDYKRFHSDFAFVFNSYYESIGKRVVRTNRGNLSRPSVDEIMQYRSYVDLAIEEYLTETLTPELERLLEIGINHEQQHQELLLTDIKYILGNNPLLPTYSEGFSESGSQATKGWIEMKASKYPIGYTGDEFSFDNEHAAHEVWLDSYEISRALITNGEFLEFMTDSGYERPEFWHSEGIDWVRTNNITAPMYWHLIDGEWYRYSLGGLEKVNSNDVLTHVSFYEAHAFAEWKELRLPTEFEWEVAQSHFDWGRRWEWTGSAYLSYPGYKKPAGAVGEYNGKFMVNQMVLRGASIATAQGHSRPTYRNFFHPHLRWQFTGIRLAK